MPVLQLKHADLAFGHVPLLKAANLVVEAKERLCLIGRNGTGKSSLLNVLDGGQALDSGQLWLADGVKVAKLAQSVPRGDQQTLYDVVAAGVGDVSGLLSRYHALASQVAQGQAEDLDKLSSVQEEIEQMGAWDASQKVDTILTRLNLPDQAKLSECSGGIRRRAMLGQALASDPDILLLDEPTNHLDITSIAALEDAILGFAGTVVFVTHDRSLISRVATRIVELDRGTLRSYPGDYAAYQKQKQQELDAEANEQRKFDQTLAEEEIWIRQGIKARRTRNEGRVRRLQTMREERRARLERTGKVKLSLDQGDHSGKLVIEAEGVSFGFANQTIIRDFAAMVLRGDRVGVIGPNGSGKSTLIKLLIGELTPSQGVIKLGTGLNVAYFDQERMQLDPELSVRDNIAQGTDQVQIGDKTKHVISYIKDFLFPAERAQSLVKSLSGGERNRLLLAKLFAKPANLLVLDEPTNDLDVETLELLEELLLSYTGTLLLVSHDRTFLDQSVTSTLVIGQSGQVEEFVGGYSDWQRQTQPNHSVTPSKQAKATKTAKPKPKPNAERELSRVMKQIEQLEQRQAQLNEQIAAPGFYQGEQKEIDETLGQLADTATELESAYERWTELED